MLIQLEMVAIPLAETVHTSDHGTLAVASVLRGITYVYRHRCGTTLPTREEFFVAAPGVVETKARYGLEWFEQRWEQPQRSLFPLESAA
jgi:hypothetical protein